MAGPGFSKGNKLAKGGKRNGAGRTPEEFKNLCKNILDKKGLVEWVGKVAAGEETESRVTPQGDVREVDVPASVRLEAVRFLSERAYGKPMQEIAHSAAQGARIWNVMIVGPEDAGDE